MFCIDALKATLLDRIYALEAENAALRAQQFTVTASGRANAPTAVCQPPSPEEAKHGSGVGTAAPCAPPSDAQPPPSVYCELFGHGNLPAAEASGSVPAPGQGGVWRCPECQFDNESAVTACRSCNYQAALTAAAATKYHDFECAHESLQKGKNPDGSFYGPAELWPNTKLVANVQRMCRPGAEAAANRAGGGQGQTRTCAVLVTTGALNPVHRGHIEMLEIARRALNEQLPGCPVVAGFISPSHELYVKPKCSRFGLHCWSAEHRTAMVDLAVSGSDWLDCGRWESAQDAGYWPDFPEVCEAAAAHARALQRPLGSGAGGGDPPAVPANVEIQVFYVCGTDLFHKCGLGRCGGAEWGGGVVVVTREGERQPVSDPSRLVFAARPTVADAATAGFSSTKVRERLQGGARVADLSVMLHPAVARYLTTGAGRGSSEPPITAGEYGGGGGDDDDDTGLPEQSPPNFRV
jgi:nicotinic acid mononucleotide adenylyltransferase